MPFFGTPIFDSRTPSLAHPPSMGHPECATSPPSLVHRVVQRSATLQRCLTLLQSPESELKLQSSPDGKSKVKTSVNIQELIRKAKKKPSRLMQWTRSIETCGRNWLATQVPSQPVAEGGSQWSGVKDGCKPMGVGGGEVGL